MAVVPFCSEYNEAVILINQYLMRGKITYPQYSCSRPILLFIGIRLKTGCIIHVTTKKRWCSWFTNHLLNPHPRHQFTRTHCKPKIHPVLHNYIPRTEGSGDVMVLRQSRPPPAARRPPPATRRPPPAARNGVNAITQKPRDGLFSNLVYTLVVIVSWPD